MWAFVFVSSLSVIFSSSYVVAYISTSFQFTDEYYSCVYTDYNLFIHSFPDVHLGCFHLLATMDNAAVNIRTKLLCGHAFNSFWCIPRSGITGSCSNYNFNILRECQIVSQNVFAILKIPSSVYQGSQFLHILINTCYFPFFKIIWSGTTLWFWFTFP